MTIQIERRGKREIRFISEDNEGPFTRDECEYLIGQSEPHYPMPVTMDDAVMSLYHSPLITVWSIQWFKRLLKL